MANWVIQPDVDRVPIGGNGDWLELKRELTYGDRRYIRKATFSGVTAPDKSTPGGPSTTYQIDPTAYELATVEAYLVAWSLKGPDDKPLDISTPAKKRDVLENTLHEQAFADVLAAVTAHVDDTAKKKIPPTTDTPGPTAG